MARLNLLGCTLWVTCWMTWMSAFAARPALRDLPPEWIGVMLRMTLPVAPSVSNTLVTLNASEHWHQLVATVLA